MFITARGITVPRAVCYTGDMADQFLQISLVDDPDSYVIFESHILPVGKSSRSRAASVYEWTPVDLTNPGSAVALGIGPLQWRISGPVVLGTFGNPRMLSPEGLLRWAMLETWVGKSVVVIFGEFAYGVWIIKDVNMDGDIIARVPEVALDPLRRLPVDNWWMGHLRHQWRMNLVQEEPPPSNDDRPALYGGLLAVTELPTPTLPTGPTGPGTPTGPTTPVAPDAPAAPSALGYYWTGPGLATLQWQNGAGVSSAQHTVQALVNNMWVDLSAFTLPAIGALTAFGSTTTTIALTGVTDGTQVRVQSNINGIKSTSAPSITMNFMVPAPSNLIMTGSDNTADLLWTMPAGTREINFEWGVRVYDNGSGDWRTWNSLNMAVAPRFDVMATIQEYEDDGVTAQIIVEFTHPNGGTPPGATVVQLRVRASVFSQAGGYETPWVESPTAVVTPEEAP